MTPVNEIGSLFGFGPSTTKAGLLLCFCQNIRDRELEIGVLGVVKGIGCFDGGSMRMWNRWESGKGGDRKLVKVEGASIGGQRSRSKEPGTMNAYEGNARWWRLKTRAVGESIPAL